MITAYDYHVILERAGLPISGVSFDSFAASVNGWNTTPDASMIATAQALLDAAQPVELSASGNMVYISGLDGNLSVDLLVGAQLVTVELDVFARATLEIIFPDGVTERVVKCANQAVNGYAEVIVSA